MAILRFFRLFLLIAGLGLFEALAQSPLPDKTVTSRKSLDSIAAELKGAGKVSRVRIQFEEYANVGNFRPDDSVLRRIDTLIFERSPKSQGFEHINVKSTLMDIKAHAGTLILRGLAFNLENPNAILLSGYDFNRMNKHLVIDSCFIFGDTVSSAFLSWYGDTGSAVQISRSFLVFKYGLSPINPKLLFNASKFSFMNDLFNFPGSVNASVISGGDFTLRNSSVNRTQFNLSSTVFEMATYKFNLNYIGHPPAQDALDGGSSPPYFLKATGFDILNSTVQNNILYKGWAGFDHRANGTDWFKSGQSNELREATQGKLAGELWDWYPPNADSTRGMGSGSGARQPRYNVFTAAKDTMFGVRYLGNALDVRFKPALFPRYLGLNFVPVAVPDTFQPSLRILSPDSGAVRFGPFQVTSLKLSTVADFGKPVLIAVDSGGKLAAQKAGPDSTPYLFPNALATARSFYFAFQGNTPRGDSVKPALAANQLGPDDSLVFAKVNAAGMTKVKDFARAYPEFYRDLKRSYRIETSASISGKVLLGTRSNALAPWDSTQVFWWGADGTEPIAPDHARDGRLLVSLTAADAMTVSLIEKLNVRKNGKTIFPLERGGKIVVSSENGFQMRIDSASFKPDPLKYGLATSAYALRFPGRTAKDTVLMQLPAGPDVGLFKTKSATNDTVMPVANASSDDSGYFRIHVGLGDSGVKIFSAIAYNVMADSVFSDSLKGPDNQSWLIVDGLKSATSGLFRPAAFNPALWSNADTTGNVLPGNAILLGGTAFRTFNLTAGPDTFAVRYDFRRPTDPAQLRAFAWDRVRWRSVGLDYGADSLHPALTGLRVGDSAAIVLELLRPPKEYLEFQKGVTEGSINVSAKYKRASAHGPYSRFAVQIRSVDQTGIVTTVVKAGPVDILDTAINLNVPLDTYNGILSSRILFYDSAGSIANPTEKFEDSISIWKPANLLVNFPVKEKYAWHLVGFPYGKMAMTLGQTLHRTGFVDSLAKDTTTYLQLQSKPTGEAVWDRTTVKDSSYKFRAGEGVLFSSAAMHRYEVPPLPEFLPAQAAVLNQDGKPGWRFVSVPFPMDFTIAKIQSTVSGAKPIYRLRVQPKTAQSGSGGNEYAWVQMGEAEKLEPFKAYAYHFQPGETLTFNPWDAVDIPLSKTAATEAEAVDLSVVAAGLPSSARIVSGPGSRDVPFLPSPGNGLEMRMGGNGGYLRKRVDDLSGIDLPIRFESPQAESARLSVRRTGVGAPGWRAMLIDLASGAAIDPAVQSLALPSGASEYRLVAGSEAFVQERVGRFQAGLPASLVLSQNAPNPFRGMTRITLDWPAMAYGTSTLTQGSGRRAYLEVFDARGKRMRRLDLGKISAGRQSVVVDATGWEPGIYAYRLSVLTGAGVSRLQKRMLVIR